MTTYVLRQLNQQGEPTKDNSSTPIYYSYQDAEAMAYYIFRKYDELYAIETTEQENK